MGLKWLWTDLGLRLAITGLRIREKHFPIYYWDGFYVVCGVVGMR